MNLSRQRPLPKDIDQKYPLQCGIFYMHVSKDDVRGNCIMDKLYTRTYCAFISLLPPFELYNLMPAVAFDILGMQSKRHVASLRDLTNRLR